MNNPKVNTMDLNKGSRKIAKIPLTKGKINTSNKFSPKRIISSKATQLIEKKNELASKTKKDFVNIPPIPLFSQARLINPISNISKTINYRKKETSIR